MSPARARRTRLSQDPIELRRRPHIHTVSFDPTEDAWVDALVTVLQDHEVPSAARSAIIRVALQTLRDALAGRTPQEIAKFFVQRDADRVLATFDGTSRLPFD
jgi:hypothetical protein